MTTSQLIREINSLGFTVTFSTANELGPDIQRIRLESEVHAFEQFIDWRQASLANADLVEQVLRRAIHELKHNQQPPPATGEEG